MRSEPILVLGASGYVGNRLVPRLLKAGHRVRASSRNANKLRKRSWAQDPRVELVSADVTDPTSLRKALTGCHTLYYLVHSMSAGRKAFERLDLDAARATAQAADAANAERIIYLGGLGVDSPRLSHHLKSRHEVGQALASTRVPVVELRAAMIIGNGSASFEILRYLVEHLPAMITPRWVRVPVQPIAIHDVLAYLEAAADPQRVPPGVYEIGGPDVLTYEQLFRLYQDAAHLPRRLIVPVPVLTPRLSSYWIRLVTPMPATLARPLAEGLRNRVVVNDPTIQELVPLDLTPAGEAVRQAVHAAEADFQNGHQPGPAPPTAPRKGDATWSGGLEFQDEREAYLDVPPEEAWDRLVHVGHQPGWHGFPLLWSIRNAVDAALGGRGNRHGQDPDGPLREGGTLDSWRVQHLDPPRRIQLASEMKIPGQGVMEFRLEPHEGGTRLTQSVRFRPRGLGGLAYWTAMFPAHMAVFHRMFDRIQTALTAPATAARD